jgi:hypothetical protein
MPKHKIEMPPNGELKFWWALFWRQLLCIPGTSAIGGVAGALLGFIVGLLSNAIGLPEQTALGLITLVAGAVGIVIGLLLNFLVVKDVLGREFNGYVLAFVPEDQLTGGKSGPVSSKKLPKLDAFDDSDDTFLELDAEDPFTPDLYDPSLHKSAYVNRNGKVHSEPVATEQLKKLFQGGKLLPTDKLSKSPDGPWTAVSDLSLH